MMMRQQIWTNMAKNWKDLFGLTQFDDEILLERIIQVLQYLMRKALRPWEYSRSSLEWYFT